MSDNLFPSSSLATHPSHPYTHIYIPKKQEGRNIHALRTPCNLAPLLQTVDLALAIGICLALHEVIVEGLAARADEVGCAKEGCAAGTYFFDGRYARGQGSRVDELFAGEPVPYLSVRGYGGD
jgi:hypothetical protein